jgi:hypothetical protein
MSLGDPHHDAVPLPEHSNGLGCIVIPECTLDRTPPLSRGALAPSRSEGLFAD